MFSLQSLPVQIWPISQESGPFLVALWVTLATSLYFVFFSKRGNTVHSNAMKQRYDSKIKLLQTLIFFEETRLARKQQGTGAGKPEDSVDDVESCNDKPPSAQSVYNLVFEEVEEEPVTLAIGIAEDDPWYLRAVTLLKKLVQAELEEALDKTKQAQTIQSVRKCDLSQEEQLVMDYQDGEKLATVLEFTREKVVKHFKNHVACPTPAEGGHIAGIELMHFDRTYLEPTLGKELRVVDRSYVVAAETVLADVRAAQKAGISYIFDIMRPVLPTYCLGLLVMLLARAFEAPLWAKSLPSYKASVAMINPNATEGEFGYGPQILQDAQAHAIFFIVGFLFSRPVEMIADSLANKASREFSSPLRHAVMSAIMKQDTQYFDFHPSSVLQQRLNRDTDELVENLLHTPRMTLQALFRVLQRTITLYFVAPQMMWACLMFNVPLFTLFVLATSAPLRRLLGQRDRGQEVATAATIEILSNIKTVRQFSMEKSEVSTYALSNLTRGFSEDRIRVLESLTHNMRFVMHIAGEMYVIYTAVNLAVQGEADIADAIVASTVGLWLQHDMKELMTEIPKLLKVMKPVRRVASLLSVKPRIEHDPSNKDLSLRRPESFKGSIEFKDVTFSYPTERQKQVLGGLSFTAKAGQKVAFVGKAGCGKSTSMDLLQRFYSRTGGEITIDGHSIDEYDTNYLRKSCGVVSQVNVLFSRSIYENIVYGMTNPPDPDSELFIEICKKAQAWEFIKRFPNKQYTQVGEKGVKLSGGQKQRIAIARVIIRQPTFLFLDEATSALDSINEKNVQKALDEMLEKFNGVAIVVAHRLTTIRNCDKIVVMGDDGTKVEEGTHEQLMKVPKQVDAEGNPVVGPGLYHTLWDTQQMTDSSQQMTETSQNMTDISQDEMEKRLQRKDKEIQELKNELASLRVAGIVGTDDKQIRSKDYIVAKWKSEQICMADSVLPHSSLSKHSRSRSASNSVGA